MARPLEFLDDRVAKGHPEFTFEEAVAALGTSPTATANALRRLISQGLLDRVAQGTYAVRPLGSLGTSVSTDDLPLAVGAAFKGLSHRIAYASALGELGLLSHPTRSVYVACTKQVRRPSVGRRPLKVVIESARTIHLEAEKVGLSWRSTLERALLECALRMELGGGVERLAEALSQGAADADSRRIHRLAGSFGTRGRAAERRLASLTQALQLPLELGPRHTERRPVIKLDPRDDRIEWIDGHHRVAWNLSVNELRAVVGN